ncbi:ABC transporter ATP-binding protein [Allofournierella massiliensis]|uniref:ATP-binding cassette subfamily B protein n=1 Tax=Allofournierella massiliensis TaxID=1650663 RepID=A0A4R1QPA9_9FIRM|nr:ABC transporter ATP-binding protein [Fournierella massiliensis]TCL50195.1 ATP-binding cassette subfamily B protein [Fournierella massiliensis]
MLKLKRYLKPYLGLLLVGVALLFGQAMLELTLPNYMSDIVNVGLQQGGITQAAPEVIDSDAMAMMQMFMSEEDKALVNAAYEPLSEREDAADLKETYPNAGDEDLALAADPENGVNEAFNRAAYALVSMMEELAPADSATQSEEQASGTLDAEAMVQLTAMLQSGALDEQLNEAIATAAVTPESMLDQTGVVLTKSFYTQLGADTDAIQTSYILKVGLRMAGLAILLTVCAISAGFCMARLGAGVGRDLRRDVFRKVSYFNNNEMDQFSGASLITRSTNDITQVQNFLSIGLRMMCFAPIMGIGGLIMGLSKCLNLAWVLALALIVMLGLILTLFAVAMPRFKKMQTLIDRLNLVSREELSGLMVVRAFSNQPFMQNRFEKANKDLTGNTLFVNRAMATMMPFMMLVMNGLSLLIVWFGGKQIAASNLQVGDMMAFIQYAMQVIMSFLFISMMFIMVPRASVSAERINEVFTCESTVADPAQPTEMNHPVKGVVEFKDVSFRYEGADANVLEHVSFTARPGETVAFIGATGSGKSTLVNLIPRFYDATEGSITVDGVDVRQLRQKDLRDAIGYVPQKGLLFSGTVATNLRYGRADASDELLKESADIAQATEFIQTLENGMDTAISQGGTNVSGGQRQRLSIARALVKQAPIYIFDDTFSALDFKTDAKLRAALKGYTEKSTVFIVAQRVSTIMHADQILVLDEGRVVGKGTHEELLKNCETYREIAESQLSKEELA